MPRALNTGTCIQQGDPFYSAGQHRKKLGEVLEKTQVNGWKCRKKQERKKSLAVSVACMAIYWPTPGLKGRTFKLCVLTRWDFNFCVRSSPMRGEEGRQNRRKHWVINDAWVLKYRCLGWEIMTQVCRMRSCGFESRSGPLPSSHRRMPQSTSISAWHAGVSLGLTVAWGFNVHKLFC